MIGGHDARNVMIVSNKHTEIMDRIHEVLERGTTILEATGGYSSEKRPVIMAVVSKSSCRSWSIWCRISIRRHLLS